MINENREDEFCMRCNGCKNFAVLYDPDIDDYMRGDDKKAICLACNGKVISRNLDAYDISNVLSPSWCPGKEKFGGFY